MGQETDEELTVDRLCSGDRPSTYIAGMTVAEAFRRGPVVVLMADALGRVQLMPSETVQVLKGPRLLDADLHKLTEDQAILLMSNEGRTEQEMVGYLKRREEANA